MGKRQKVCPHSKRFAPPSTFTEVSPTRFLPGMRQFNPQFRPFQKSAA